MTVSRALVAGSALLGGAVAAGAAALRLPVFGASPEGARLDRMRRSPQWHDGAFRNPEPDRTGVPLGATWEFLTANRDLRRPSEPVPTVLRSRSDFEAARDLRVTWLGHSTALLEVEGRRFLTDPVWSRTASPADLLGVARFFEPPLLLGALPDLDAVLVTHDHYDHLDWQTVRRLAGRVPRWVVPLGVGAHLERWGIAPGRITEVDWWDEVDVSGVRVVSTPARHFSGRSLSDRNRTLWCGYALLGAERRGEFSFQRYRRK